MWHSTTWPSNVSNVHWQHNGNPGDLQTHLWTVHSNVPAQSILTLVHGRGDGWNGVYRSRVKHERPCVRIPAVSGMRSLYQPTLCKNFSFLLSGLSYIFSSSELPQFDYLNVCRWADKFCLHWNTFIYIRHFWMKPVLCSPMVSFCHHTSPWTHRCLQSSTSAHRNERVFRRSIQTACCYWILNRGKSSSNWN